MSSRASRTLYVGNLPGDIREREVEDLFYKDGYDFDGHRLRVELAHGGRGHLLLSTDRYSGHSGGGGGGGGRGGRGVSRRSEYRVMVSRLPSSASWQDLKDHMRRAGDLSILAVAILFEVEGKTVLKFTLCYGFRNLQNVVRKIKTGKCDYHFLEIMACPSGCLNGGGQIKPKPGQSGKDLIQSLETAYMEKENMIPIRISQFNY
ncbi:hypothetical protein F8388_013969 [Cannabis sativa]|uniref:Iron hydrogenase large subunit C-terminal domain-containing protein n=1 Tax=Cannabis sativa TaxID=3483 RepID=A0A7J6F882_CANSA|nr:hypothetical protein F8388_013969 [Cannabis sativa]